MIKCKIQVKHQWQKVVKCYLIPHFYSRVMNTAT